MKDYKDSRPRGTVVKKSTLKRNSNLRKALPRVAKIAAVIAGVVAIVLLFRFSHRAILTSTYFGLKEIVVTGEKRVKKDEIKALSGVRIGENILAMDLKGISKRIEGQPWIERANVRRILPTGLSLDVKEREPFAILKADTFYYVDRGGTPFKELDEGDERSFPLITGLKKEDIEGDESVRDLLMKTLDFIETESGEWPADISVSEFNVNRSHGITVFSEGTEIRIGFGEYKVKLKRLKRAMEDLKARGKTAVYIDLTYTGQVVVR